MLFANSPAILTKSFPAEMRGRALGLQATMTYLGLTIGPSIGGWLATALGWRSVFYINLPVGLLALALALRFVPRDEGSGGAEAFDLRGAVTFTAGLVALLLALNQGTPGADGPGDAGALAASVVLLIAFVRLERSVPAPMVDLSLFRRRTFSAAAASALLNYVCVYTLLFLMPFYLLQARGMSPARAGLLLTAQPLLMAAVAPISGTLSDRIGTRLPSVLGMGLFASDLFLPPDWRSTPPSHRGRNAGRGRPGDRDLRLPQQQRADGRRAGAPAGNRRRASGAGPQRRHGDRRRPGRRGVHHGARARRGRRSRGDRRGDARLLPSGGGPRRGRHGRRRPPR
jgi:hypothetical protein